MRNLNRIAIALLVTVISGLHGSFAQTEISGPQSGTLNAGTYIVTGDITVQNGSTLIIGPGAEFKHRYGTKWDIHGEFKAEGTADQKIRFVFDDTGDSVTWRGLKFFPDASDDCILDYCVFENAQGNEWGGAVHIDLVDMTVKNSEFRYGKCVYYAPVFLRKIQIFLLEAHLFSLHKLAISSKTQDSK